MVIHGDQLETFERRGVLWLEHFLPADVVSRARSDLETSLERNGLRAQGAWTIEHIVGLPAHKANKGYKVSKG